MSVILYVIGGIAIGLVALALGVVGRAVWEGITVRRLCKSHEVVHGPDPRPRRKAPVL